MQKLNIATFNLNKDYGNFPERIYNLSNIINKSKFDLICFQDDFTTKNFTSSKFLNLELDYYSYTSKPKEYSNESSDLSLLSKFELIPLKKLFFYKEKKKNCICQFFQIKSFPYKTIIVNINLSSLNSRERSEQIDEILNSLKTFTKHELVLLAGTFNALPSYFEIEKIRKNNFLSINKEFTCVDKLVLDYIFYQTKLKVKIENKVSLKTYSSHYCISNILRFDKKD